MSMSDKLICNYWNVKDIRHQTLTDRTMRTQAFASCRKIECTEKGVADQRSNIFQNLKIKASSHLLVVYEPHREKTGFLPMRKQRRRSASR